MVMVGRQETKHDGEISRTVHKDLWKMKLKNYILHQTTATATKLQTERSQPLWIQGQNSDRKLPLIQETQEAQNKWQKVCARKLERKLINKQTNPHPPRSTHKKEIQWERTTNNSPKKH